MNDLFSFHGTISFASLIFCLLFDLLLSFISFLFLSQKFFFLPAILLCLFQARKFNYFLEKIKHPKLISYLRVPSTSFITLFSLVLWIENIGIVSPFQLLRVHRRDIQFFHRKFFVVTSDNDVLKKKNHSISLNYFTQITHCYVYDIFNVQTQNYQTYQLLSSFFFFLLFFFGVFVYNQEFLVPLKMS